MIPAEPPAAKVQFGMNGIGFPCRMKFVAADGTIIADFGGTNSISKTETLHLAAGEKIVATQVDSYY